MIRIRATSTPSAMNAATAQRVRHLVRDMPEGYPGYREGMTTTPQEPLPDPDVVPSGDPVPIPTPDPATPQEPEPAGDPSPPLP